MCYSPPVAKSSSVKNGNALWAEKEEKMLMFCSLALLVKIKLCGGNLCESGFFFIVVLLPSLQHCGGSCPVDLTAELLPYLIVLQDETHARKRADGFFRNPPIFLALQVPFLLLLPDDF